MHHRWRVLWGDVMGSLTVKESGEMVNIISPNVSNITSFKVHFNPKQEGSDDPSPENVRNIVGWNGGGVTRCGKNLMKISAETRVYLSGSNYSNFTEDNNIVTITGSSHGGYRVSCKPNTQYTYSCEPTLKSGGVYLRVWEEIGEERNPIINQNVNSTKGAVATFITGANVYSLIVGFYIYSTAAQTGLIISDFQLELGSEATSYEPYQGTELNINWTNNIKQWIHTDSSFDTYSSNTFNGYGNSLWDNAITDIPAEWFNKSLTYSVYIDRAESPYTPYDDVRVWFYGDSTTMKEASSAYRITEPSSSGRSWVTFTIPEGTTKLALGLLISKGSRAYNPQLEFGEEPTEYQPYVGDVYGGYVDLISGELVSSWICSKIKNLDGTWNYKSGNLRFQIDLQSNFAKTDSTGWTNFATAEAYKKSTSNAYANGQIATYNKRYIYIRDDSFDGDVEAFLEAVGDTKVAYELAESTTYQLTPQQLSTLKGQNNFWSNVGYVEIEYELTETFDIQKAKRKIILNQPHVESASGDLVTFDTDMKGKLKECKVYFSPVQEGSGDPSPENIREIMGWNEIEGYNCGKNLAHIFGYGTQNIADTNVNNYKTTNNYGTTINTTIFNNPDTPLIIEQSQAPNSTTPTGYQNGYIVIGTDNLIFGQKYNVSFKVSNITNNILNISLNNIKLLAPNGSTTSVTEIIDDVLIFKNITFYQNTTTPKRQGFEIRICGLSFTLSEFMVTAVDNNDFTYEPYQPTIISTDWTEDVGTVYGGYVDLISGELVAEYEYMTDTWGNWGTLSDCGDGTELRYKRFTNTIIGNTAGQGVSYCNVAKYSFNNANGEIHFYNVASSNNCRIYLPSGTNENLQIQVVGKLAEPIRYQLTPQQLTALRGANAIYSNANGQIDIKYWTRLLKINYMKDVLWLDHSYITSAGKFTEESTALSHTTVNSIFLPAGNYRIDGFCYQEPPANSLNCRVHEYSAGGSWVKLITSNTADTMSPYILEFSLDHDSYIKLSLPRLLDAKLIKI